MSIDDIVSADEDHKECLVGEPRRTGWSWYQVRGEFGDLLYQRKSSVGGWGNETFVYDRTIICKIV